MYVDAQLQQHRQNTAISRSGANTHWVFHVPKTTVARRRDLSLLEGIISVRTSGRIFLN